MKKIEIVTDYVSINKFTAKFDELNVPGYSIIKDVLGKGSQGNKDGHGLMAGSKNCYMMLCCEDSDVQRILVAIKPLIKTYGGMCIVSEVLFMHH